jgi:hypothetical protein
MPRAPTIHNTPLHKEFVCAQCNRKFRSNAGRTRHINAKHGGLQLNYPQSELEEADHLSDLSSHPGFPSPTLSNIFDSPSRNLDTFNFGAGSEHDFNFSNDNIDNTPPLSPSQDTAQASSSIEYHPYLNGKMNNL